MHGKVRKESTLSTMRMYTGNVRIYASTLEINLEYLSARIRYNSIRSRFSNYNKLRSVLALLLHGNTSEDFEVI